MNSFVFNNFKKDYVLGNNTSADTWKFIPVSQYFLDTIQDKKIPLENYETFNDILIALNTDENRDKSFQNVIKQVVNYTYKKAETGEAERPTYVNVENYDAFINSEIGKSLKKRYKKQDTLNNFKDKGFFIITKIEELRWFSDYVNNVNNYANAILADNIEERWLEYDPIGKDEKHPFEGTFDGAGHIFKNCGVKGNNNNNGIFGVIGKSGVVKNLSIKIGGIRNSFDCNKLINLSHIKANGSDINIGYIAGKNFGTISAISVLPTAKNSYLSFKRFVPQVYTVANKSDSYNDFTTIRDKFQSNDENYYYLNSFCINSPGNICPYVGYFNCGVYAKSAYNPDVTGQDHMYTSARYLANPQSFTSDRLSDSCRR